MIKVVYSIYKEMCDADEFIKAFSKFLGYSIRIHGTQEVSHIVLLTEEMTQLY